MFMWLWAVSSGRGTGPTTNIHIYVVYIHVCLCLSEQNPLQYNSFYGVENESIEGFVESRKFCSVELVRQR